MQYLSCSLFILFFLKANLNVFSGHMTSLTYLWLLFCVHKSHPTHTIMLSAAHHIQCWQCAVIIGDTCHSPPLYWWSLSVIHLHLYITCQYYACTSLCYKLAHHHSKYIKSTWRRKGFYFMRILLVMVQSLWPIYSKIENSC